MPAEAVLRALRHVWLTLEPLDLPMAVMGGIALAEQFAEAWTEALPGEPPPGVQDLG
jgi:hypothetical protein